LQTTEHGVHVTKIKADITVMSIYSCDFIVG